MIRVLAFVIAAFSAVPALSGELEDELFEDLLVPAGEVTLDQYLWKKRLLVVFSNSELDPQFTEQLDLLSERPNGLAARDVLIVLDSDPSEETELREEFRPRGFMLVLVGKDGEVYLRKPVPWDVREISRSIDKLPLRQREMREAS
jgi:hypothetical protein